MCAIQQYKELKRILNVLYTLNFISKDLMIKQDESLP